MAYPLRALIFLCGAGLAATPGSACPFDGDGTRFFAFAGMAGHAASAPVRDGSTQPAAQAPASVTGILQSVRRPESRNTDEALPERSAAPSAPERRASRTWSGVADEMRP